MRTLSARSGPQFKSKSRGRHLASDCWSVPSTNGLRFRPLEGFPKLIPLMLNSKSGVVFPGSCPSHKTYGIVSSREVALGFASKLRREAFDGAAQRHKNFGGNDACGGVNTGNVMLLVINPCLPL